uniref:glutathione transferase n=1 Tax=Euplotes harpa TaxID=151035 RepID=A0A7S3JI25_9SPIT|mmetsp:Transcript_41433/g.47775  ORF Transcript_41433/g.47775 Transcript_41433/m.47775 type:complete len:221 (+) Transcript_41433:26-688(+)
MEESDKLVISYWKIRGLIRHILLVAEYARAPYEVKYYEAGDDNSGKEWFDIKHSLGLHFPNLPNLQHGDFNLSETLVIIHYICDKFKPDLLGDTPEERATVMMLAHIAHDAKTSATGLCYSQDDKEKVLECAYSKLANISKFLGEKKFLLGDKVCYVDLYLSEFLSLVEAVDGGDGLSTKYSNLAKLRKTVEDLPEIADFLSSDRCHKLKFNWDLAKINP